MTFEQLRTKGLKSFDELRAKPEPPDFGMIALPREKLPGVWDYDKQLDALLGDPDKDIEDFIPLDVRYNFGRIVGMTEKPDETKAKMKNSLYYSILFGTSPRINFNILDELNKVAFHKPIPVEKALKEYSDYYTGAKSYVGAIKHGLRRANVMAQKQIGGLAKMVGEFIEPQERVRPLFPALNEWEKGNAEILKEWSDMILEDVGEYYRENKAEAIQILPGIGYWETLKQYITNPVNLVQGIIESGPLMLEGILGMTIGGPAGGIAVMGVPIWGDVYADARAEDTQPLPAMAQAILTGTGEATIEQWTLSRKLGLMRNFRRIVADGLPKVLWEGTKAFFRGTAEEGSQEFNRNWWRWVFTDRSQQWTENVAESMAAGGPMEMVMAGAFSVAGAVGPVVPKEQQVERLDKIQEAIEAEPTLTSEHKAEIRKEIDTAREDVAADVYKVEEEVAETPATVPIPAPEIAPEPKKPAEAVEIPPITAEAKPEVESAEMPSVGIGRILKTMGERQARGEPFTLDELRTMSNQIEAERGKELSLEELKIIEDEYYKLIGAQIEAMPSEPEAVGVAPEGKVERQDLIEEAKKYKSAEEFIKAQDAKRKMRVKTAPQEGEYIGQHQAPMSDSGAPGHDLTLGVYPEDIYGYQAAQFYGHFGQNHPLDMQTISIIKSMKNRPDKLVRIYRAVPKGKNIKTINVGDWVTINRNYAKDHGESQFDIANYKIISKQVHARDIYTDGNSIHEWGYDPQEFTPASERPLKYLQKQRQRVQGIKLTDIWEEAKLAKPPTEAKPEAKIKGLKTTEDTGKEFEIGGAKWKVLGELEGRMAAERIDEGTGKGKRGFFDKSVLKAEELKVGDIVTDGLVRGRIIGEGTIGKREWPGYKIEILSGHEKGAISIMAKDEAKLVQKLTKPIEKAPELTKQPEIVSTVAALEEKAEPEKAKLRQKIHAIAAVKGLTKKALSDLKRKHVGFRRLTGKVASKKITTEQLQNLLKAVQKARPKRVGYKRVITRKTEKKIQSLKENLMKKTQMTERHFDEILEIEVHGKEPKYTDAKSFITETQGKDILRRMLDTAEIVRLTESFEQAIAKNPEIADRVKLLDSRIEKSPKRDPFSLESMRYYNQQAEIKTGAPIFTSYMDLMDTHLEITKTRTATWKRLEKTTEKFKEIAKDEEALQRVSDYITSQSTLKEKPAMPTDITADEIKLAKEIQKILEEYRLKVRVAKFYNWYYYNQPIPDHDRYTKEITKAVDIYESKGREELIEYLDTQEWGVIKSGYEPLEILFHKVRPYTTGPTAVGKGHIKIRTDIEYHKQERNILQRLSSYMRQIDMLYNLSPKINAYVRLFDDNANKFSDWGKVKNDIEIFIRNLKRYNIEGGFFQRVLSRAYSQAMRVIIMPSPVLSFRNLFQNAAFEHDKSILIDPRNTKLTSKDIEYLETYILQTRAMVEEYFMIGEKPLPGLGFLTKLIDKVKIYPYSDIANRHWSFWAKTNQVERALKAETTKQMMTEAKFEDMKELEQRRALAILARDGKEAMSQYVGRVHVDDIHFLYERSQRSPAEMTSLGKIVGNLMLFPRAYGEKLAHVANKTLKGKTYEEQWRGLKTMFAVVGGGMIVGSIYTMITGRKRNPYNPLEILAFRPGGLAWGSIEAATEIYANILSAAKGDSRALAALTVAIPRAADMFIPFYDYSLRAIEAATDQKNIDRKALRQMRMMIDKEYKIRGGAYKVKRDALEKWQYFLSGPSADKEEKRKRKPKKITY